MTEQRARPRRATNPTDQNQTIDCACRSAAAAMPRGGNFLAGAAALGAAAVLPGGTTPRARRRQRN